jgi:hypothetical protein
MCPLLQVENYKEAAEKGVPMSVGKAFILDKE